MNKLQNEFCGNWEGFIALWILFFIALLLSSRFVEK